jgi:hypothetical protein
VIIKTTDDIETDQIIDALYNAPECRAFLAPPSRRLIVKRNGHSITRQIPKPVVLINTREKTPFDFSEFPNWIAGISREINGYKLIYAMQVNEILLFDKYYNNRRFVEKIPDNTKKVLHSRGDNIYKPLPDVGFKQLQSLHSNTCKENIEEKEKDLSGKNVLISNNFYYFGSKPLDLPDTLNVLKGGHGHKNRFSSGIVSAFINFISFQTAGINAPPTDKWPTGDDSWRVDPL